MTIAPEIARWRRTRARSTLNASPCRIRPLWVGRLAADDSHRKMLRQPVRPVRRIGNWMKTLAVFAHADFRRAVVIGLGPPRKGAMKSPLLQRTTARKGKLEGATFCHCFRHARC